MSIRGFISVEMLSQNDVRLFSDPDWLRVLVRPWARRRYRVVLLSYPQADRRLPPGRNTDDGAGNSRSLAFVYSILPMDGVDRSCVGRPAALRPFDS